MKPTNGCLVSRTRINGRWKEDNARCGLTLSRIFLRTIALILSSETIFLHSVLGFYCLCWDGNGCWTYQIFLPSVCVRLIKRAWTTGGFRNLGLSTYSRKAISSIFGLGKLKFEVHWRIYDFLKTTNHDLIIAFLESKHKGAFTHSFWFFKIFSHFFLFLPPFFQLLLPFFIRL